MASQFCQSTNCLERQSALTGRTVRINTELDKFFVPSQSYRLARNLAAKMAHWEIKHIPARVKPLLDAFIVLRSNQEFMRAIDELIAELTLRETIPQYKTEGVNWLIRLWAEGIIGLPAVWPFTSQIRFAPDVDCCGINSWIVDFADLGKRVSARGTTASQVLLRVAGPTQGLCEVGDVTFETVSEPAVKANRSRLAGLVTPLLAAQRDQYQHLASEVIDAWGLGRKRRGFDRSCQWVLEKDTSLSAWREAVSGWLTDRKYGFSQRSLTADRFFAYLIENPYLPRSAEAYCCRSNTIVPSWPEWLAGQNIDAGRVQDYRNTMAEFFDWYIAKSLTGEDDLGRPVQSPSHYNPVTRVRRAPNRSESHRDALPLRYIHELIQIITENDFAWPKTLRADYFPSRNENTGQLEKRWSPVRAYAMLVKLYLPLRTFQVRMLDSGEADGERYVNGQWVRNESRLTSKERKPVRRGFLRKFRDTRTEREFTGLYVNTNKTADIYRDERDKGYEVPWQHNEVIAIATIMRDWQERYNPVLAPTRWDTLHDKSILRVHSLEALQSREAVCFLFRDPCAPHRNEPVRGDRMQTFWTALVDELERRMAATGRTLPDGSPIKLIEKRSSTSGYMQPVYDLHSLRVSLITAYATEGGVPIHILSKCIAGHATILMTLYYNKPGPAYVTEKMIEAQARLAEQEQQNFVRFLQNEEFRNASPLVLCNDSAGLSSLERASPVSWVVGDIGICPASGTKCQEGGEAIGIASGKPVYGPVTGGAKNCIRCRFFVTGPAFLGGLVAQFNATGLALSGIAESLRQVENEICEIEDAACAALTDPAQHKKVGLLYERRDRLMEETDQIALNWHALYGLIERCRIALSVPGKQPVATGMSLVLAGTSTDLEVALAECSQFELLDAVCQAGAVFPNLQVPTANLRRGRLLDAMFIRNGRTPVFTTLNEQEALAVGNEMVAFLLARCGRVDTVDLIEGRRMLESTGITRDLDEMLATMASLTMDRGIETQRKLYGKKPG